jgi:hypothetical protein
MTIDYEAEIDAPDNAQLALISALAAKQVRLETEVAQAEFELKKKQKELRQVQEVDLPEAMKAAGCKAYTTSEGRGITIKEDIAASLAEGKKDAAIAWLRENGHGDIVKQDVIISFGKGQEAEANELVADLADDGYIPLQKTDVNTATLKALIRELRKRGDDVPMDLLGAYEWKKAIIK